MPLTGTHNTGDPNHTSDHNLIDNAITSIQTALPGKSAVGHSHAEADVTSLVTDLAGKAASTHTHAESDVTSLVADLSAKASSTHTHAESDVTSLTTDLAGKASATHTHAESDVTSLATDLANRLVKSNNLSDVSSPATARTNLGAAARGSVTLYPEDYGAVGDNTTNDYTAFNSLITATQSAWNSGAQQVIWQLDAKSYYISGALQQPDGNGGAYAVLPLRKRALSATRDVLVIQGPARPNNANGAQAAVQKIGAVLRTDVTGTYNSTHGLPSFIGAGGATDSTGSSLQNTVVILRNVGLRLADNPSIAALDLCNAEEAVLENCVIDTNVLASAITFPTNKTGVGVVMPRIGNNAVSSFRGDVEINGYYVGVLFNEHFNAEHLITYKSVISMASTQMTAHAAYIAHANCEWQNYTIAAIDWTLGAQPLPQCMIRFGMLDIEDAASGSFVPTNHVHDPNNVAQISGRSVRVLAGTGASAGLTINGGLGVAFVDMLNGQVNGNWITPTLTNSWTSAGGGSWPAPGYRKQDGVVSLRGLLNTATPGSSSCFTLPAGFRPSLNRQFAVCGDSGANHAVGFVVVQSSGAVIIAIPLPTTDLDLSGVQFVAEQ